MMNTRKVLLAVGYGWPIGFLIVAGLALFILNPTVNGLSQAQTLGLLSILGGAVVFLMHDTRARR